MPRQMLISLVLTLMVSLGVGFVMGNIIGFWEGFVGTIILQFFAYNIYKAFQKPEGPSREQVLLDNILGLQTVPIACPCGKNIFEDQVFLNTDNLFTCEKCGSKFRVDLTYDTVLQTEQVNLENIFNQLKNKEQ